VPHLWPLHSPGTRAAIENETLLRWLLAHGADPNAEAKKRRGFSAERYTPLIAAVKLSDPSPARILLSSGADMDPLAVFAAISDHTWTRGTATLELLIEQGADINYSTSEWGSPLCHAVRWVKKDQLEVLLKHGANTAYRDIQGLTAAEYAREIDQPELAAMIDAGSSTAVP
jgi:ankyrin repeat protein